MKSEFSNTERSQINSLRGVLGTVSPFAGGIRGDVTQSFNAIDNTTQGRLALGVNLASSLESVGITNKNTADVLSTTLSGAVRNKSALNKSVSTTPVDLGIPANRDSSLQNRSATEIIRENRDEITNRLNTAFPPDIAENSSAYVILKFKKYDRENQFDQGTLTPVKEILLPLPENYNQSFNMSFEETDMSMIGDFTRAAETAESSIRDAISGRSVDAGQLLDDVLSSSGAAASRLSRASLGAVSDAGAGALGRRLGYIPNPHTTIFFKGVKLRDFTWTWRLVPRNEDEAAVIREVIRELRKNVLPSRMKDGQLKYPNILKPSIETNGKANLGDFRNCHVQGMTINYAAEGASAFFRDGHPVAINLALNFQEVEIAISEDADESGEFDE